MERGVLNARCGLAPGPGAACRVTVRVQPKASRNACTVGPDGRIRIALTAPPVDGSANEALLEFAARMLDLPRRNVQLAAGAKSRDKTLAIQGLDVDAVLERFRGGQ